MGQQDATWGGGGTLFYPGIRGQWAGYVHTPFPVLFLPLWHQSYPEPGAAGAWTAAEVQGHGGRWGQRSGEGNRCVCLSVHQLYEVSHQELVPMMGWGVRWCRTNTHGHRASSKGDITGGGGALARSERAGHPTHDRFRLPPCFTSTHIHTKQSTNGTLPARQ